MKPSHFGLLAMAFGLVLAAACGPTQAQLAVTATQLAAADSASQTAAVTATASPTRTPRPTPTQTPTPAPLTAAEIFERLSPSVVFVETPSGTGSGVLLEGGYIVTNAHVVWPYDQVRVAFADGPEYVDVPVVNTDFMVDLAVVGPVDTDIPPLALVDGESQVVGSDVYLIGYPGEVDDFPRPTISSGVISRIRDAEALGVTYFQTDAQVAGGQSGGVLVTEMGEVIGLSGFAFTEVSFGLVASAADLLPRIIQLVAGEDVARLGERHLAAEGGQTEDDFELANYWDARVYVVRAPAGTEVEVNVDGANDAVLDVLDVYGNRVLSLDDGFTGWESGLLQTQSEAPHFVRVTQLTEDAGAFHIQSNRVLIAYDDTDDGRRLKLGDPLRASIDYPGDVDYFVIDLEAGDTLHVFAESVMVDPYVMVDYAGAGEAQLIFDNDSGGGIFGQDAELTYRAPHDDRYWIVVGDALGTAIGGYTLSLDQPGADAPTPWAPQATATPIDSPVGPMALYASQRYPFALQYPADWDDLGAQPEFHIVANYGTDDASLVLGEEDLLRLGNQVSLAEYTELVMSSAQATVVDFSLLSRRQTQTVAGLEISVIEYTMLAGSFRVSTMLYISEDQIAFTASYVVAAQAYGAAKPVIDYSFASFRSDYQ